MLLIPAIDLKDGHCVRLKQGDMDQFIGSEQIMSYTVIGDAVNLGSRLESLNKQYSTHIIVSDETRQRLTGQYVFRPLGDVVVKGKTRPVAIFEVVGRAGADTIAGSPAPSPAATKEARV